MADTVTPPVHVDVLVVGGGPAGSYAAAALAREGVAVALLEAAQFPRYHVGESLIPSVRHFLRFVGAEDKMEQAGFMRKPGSAIKFNQFKKEGYTDFVALGHTNSAWNVTRADFDHLLLLHARASGALVFQRTRVTDVHFDSPHSPHRRPLAVSWARGPATGRTTFAYLVDASGRAGLLSTRYLRTRRLSAALRNVAVWAYWRGAGVYGEPPDPDHGEHSRVGAPWFEALTNEAGWAWFIPLAGGLTSVGVVLDHNAWAAARAAAAAATAAPSFLARLFPAPQEAADARRARELEAAYRALLPLAPGVARLLGERALMVRKGAAEDEHGAPPPLVRTAADFSYAAPAYAGPGYRIVGDAAAFIDPFFSSGVHLALASALAAAASVCAVLRPQGGGQPPVAEADAAAWHTLRVATSYTRFQIVVLSAYKQIRAQAVGVLADVDEDNYDRAFKAIRPLIQGAGDAGARLSETELQSALDFCAHAFAPTGPAAHARARAALGAHALDVAAPVAAAPAAAGAGGDGDGDDGDGAAAEVARVLRKVNARRVVHAELALHSVEAEALGAGAGLRVRLERGRLGLVRGAEL